MAAIRTAKTLFSPLRPSRPPLVAPRMRRPRCSPTVAQAAAPTGLLESAPAGSCSGLSQYPLRADAGASRARAAAWLEPAVQEAVRHIASSSSGRAADPFLLIVRPRGSGPPFAAVPLTPAALEGGWEALAHDLGGGSAEGVLLVQPVPSPAEVPGSSCIASSSGGECKECATAASSTPAASGGASPATTVAAGRVGECCDGGHGTAAAPGTAAAAPPPAGSPHHCCGVSAYYGVVVLGDGGGGSGGGPEGCYLLKTTHLAHPELGCTCSQYCLTRVAKGPSLREQLTASWLV
ncbi:hypothetical protein Rsub_01119 [Raphidocelis subcapitata]|uniref:Uncharacterized protein n=1 Tax=Raphidocelis subcapitata TaxID=307507 RepID=A0A2V0NU09_9CHLO|nr:hypothetical protein Rsub_01119 [Raphidocelis subcapitata]|eukprot:GBF88407.1 hypothetical protein Rsub_01119 [Raphidocelis subcapitata]